MKKILLPGTKMLVSRLAFGTASLHHLPTSFQRQALLAAALEHGFTHFDTAPYYGFGLGEWEVGRCLKLRKSEVTIASKVGMYPPKGLASNSVTVWLRKGLGKIVPELSKPVIEWSIATASNSLDNTLRRLRRDHVDILFLHEPTPSFLYTEEFLHWFELQREKGKLRYWGLAGPAEHLEPWIRQEQGLSQVLQVRDCVNVNECNPVLIAGRPFQLTYGYLASARRAQIKISAAEVLRAALARNSTGSILVSTRHIAHIPELVSAVEDL